MERLNVNINKEVEVALRELAEKHDISITETMRRAVSLYKFSTDQARNGKEISLGTYDQDGREVLREVIVIS